MQTILTRQEMLQILTKGIKETIWGKAFINPKITFLNDRDDTDIENIFLITHIKIEETNDN